MKFSTGTPARLALALSFSLVLAACGNGGGGSSSSGAPVSPVPGSATYLTMYQGNWLQKTVQPMQFPQGIVGPESQRERRIFSAPDANGRITIENQIEYFDTTIAANDFTTVPYATLKTVTPFTAVYARTQTLPSIFSGASHDVLTVTGTGSTVSATAGTAAPAAITQETVSGVPSWRVTFTNGTKSVVQARNEAARTLEIAVMTSAVNGVPNGELAIYGFAQTFVKP
jgi:hypothetical protein